MRLFIDQLICAQPLCFCFFDRIWRVKICVKYEAVLLVSKILSSFIENRFAGRKSVNGGKAMAGEANLRVMAVLH